MIPFKDLKRHTFTPLVQDGMTTRGWFVMYELDDCQKCGKECRDVNSVNIGLPPGFDEKDLTIRERMPEELSWCESFEGSVCEDCYVWE